jgi:hypothetical protein
MAVYTNPLTNGHVKTEALLGVLPKRWVEMFEVATTRLPLPLRLERVMHFWSGKVCTL